MVARMIFPVFLWVLMSVVDSQSFQRPNQHMTPYRRFERAPQRAQFIPQNPEFNHREDHPNSAPFIPGARPLFVSPGATLGQIPLSPRPSFDNYVFPASEETGTSVSEFALGSDVLPPTISSSGILEGHFNDGDVSSPDSLYESKNADHIPEFGTESLTDNEVQTNSHGGNDFTEDNLHDANARTEGDQNQDLNMFENVPEEQELEDYVYDESEPATNSQKREVPEQRSDPNNFNRFGFGNDQRTDLNAFESRDEDTNRSPSFHSSFQPQVTEEAVQQYSPFHTRDEPQQQHEQNETPNQFNHQSRPDHNRRRPSSFHERQKTANLDSNPSQIQEFNFPEQERHESQPPVYQTSFYNERDNSLREFEPVGNAPSRVLEEQKPRYQGAVKRRKRPFKPFPASDPYTPKPSSAEPHPLDSARYPNYGPGSEHAGGAEEESKPDRLSVLLQQTKFNCQAKKDGYYADEELGCEVFHFCQDKVKHSWLCPNGASFHQVHLICMPESEDNICEKSSKFHFVNDYLYKETESSTDQRRTYMQRYYPAGYEGGIASLDDRQNLQKPLDQEHYATNTRAPSRRQPLNHPKPTQDGPRIQEFQQDYDTHFEEEQQDYLENHQIDEVVDRNPQYQPQEDTYQEQYPGTGNFHQDQSQHQFEEPQPRPGAAFRINIDQSRPSHGNQRLRPF